MAHHAVLAYHPWAPPPAASLLAEPRFWGGFPVVDAHRWTGWALLSSFNDIFFMALMFFLSGFFVWNSLKRKGWRPASCAIVFRGWAGLFLAAAGVLAPLAYYPAYLGTTSWPTLAGFLEQWISLGN